MFNRKYGQVYFKLKSAPCFRGPYSKYTEIVVVDDETEDGVIYKVVKRQGLIHEDPFIRVLDDCDDEEMMNRYSCSSVEINISSEDFNKIMEIIESHKEELLKVNSEVYRSDVLDGSEEELYFEGITFNREVKGDNILEPVYDENLACEEYSEKEKKCFKDSMIIQRAVSEILNYLRKFKLDI